MQLRLCSVLWWYFQRERGMLGTVYITLCGKCVGTNVGLGSPASC